MMLSLQQFLFKAGGIMNLLLVNDDGIMAPGLYCLAKWLKTKHNIVIVAPSENRSFASQSMTVNDIIKVKKHELKGLENVSAYSITGTPADCVSFALGGLLDFKPDAVISGINAGENLAGDIISSGTVGAASRACSLGFKAAAISLYNVFANKIEEFEAAGKFSLQVAEALEERFEPGVMLNINVPASEIKGIRICNPGLLPCTYGIEKRHDPYGREYYWLVYDGVTDESAESDSMLCRAGYITITGLKLLATDEKLSKRIENFFSID